MIETLLGGLLGGAFRLAPEILKWLDRQGERGHELAMQDKALEFEKLRGAQRMAEIGAASDAAWNVGAVDALRDAVAAQGQKSGVGWADALSVSVRPVITYWFMALYCAAKTAAFAAAVTAEVEKIGGKVRLDPPEVANFTFSATKTADGAARGWMLTAADAFAGERA